MVGLSAGGFIICLNLQHSTLSVRNASVVESYMITRQTAGETKVGRVGVTGYRTRTRKGHRCGVSIIPLDRLSRIMIRLLFYVAPAFLAGMLGLIVHPIVGGVAFVGVFGLGLQATEAVPERGEKRK